MGVYDLSVFSEGDEWLAESYNVVVVIGGGDTDVFYQSSRTDVRRRCASLSRIRTFTSVVSVTKIHTVTETIVVRFRKTKLI